MVVFHALSRTFAAGDVYFGGGGGTPLWRLIALCGPLPASESARLRFLLDALCANYL